MDSKPNELDFKTVLYFKNQDNKAIQLRRVWEAGGMVHEKVVNCFSSFQMMIVNLLTICCPAW